MGDIPERLDDNENEADRTTVVEADPVRSTRVPDEETVRDRGAMVSVPFDTVAVSDREIVPDNCWLTVGDSRESVSSHVADLCVTVVECVSLFESVPLYDTVRDALNPSTDRDSVPESEGAIDPDTMVLLIVDDRVYVGEAEPVPDDEGKSKINV